MKEKTKYLDIERKKKIITDMTIVMLMLKISGGCDDCEGGGDNDCGGGRCDDCGCGGCDDVGGGGDSNY